MAKPCFPCPPTKLAATLAASLGLAMSASAQIRGATPGWFEFVFPGLDSSETATDLSWLNDKHAGADGFIRVRNGHFTDGQGRRVRFFGTNLTAASCFPEKEIAPKLAARLRKLGFNVVRLHFMDIPAPNGVFLKDGKTLDEAQLDRLDFLVAQLKAHGIYTNLNLHVARRYPGIRGEAAERFGMGKVLDRFHPPFIEMQREYARALLTRRNPYTGNRYADEPALLCVELNNENTMLPFWGGHTRNLPEPYASELLRQWRGWLKKKYGSTPKLKAAWSEGEEPLGSELLQNGAFLDADRGWTLQAMGGGEARTEIVSDDSIQMPVLRWHVTKLGTENWHHQFFQTALPLTEGKSYALRFWARQSWPEQERRMLSVTAMHDKEPWQNCGLGETILLERKWREYRFVFRAQNTIRGHGRLNFSSNNDWGAFDLAGVSLREGGAIGLPDGQSFEADNITLPEAGATPAAARDHWQFLIETEQATTRGLIQFLKKDLGVKSLITDTQASYGGLAGVLREATLSDFVDMHGYWQHPEFPGREWDPNHWRIGNSSQVAATNGGTLADIAIHRVAGKPFTVSEYNTPAPNDHAAELFPLLATIAAFQDWDAIYQYTYLDFKTEWEANRILHFFDLCGHAGQLAFAPAGALIFRRGLVRAGEKPVTLTVPRDAVLAQMAAGKGNLHRVWNDAGVSSAVVSMRRLQVAIANDGGEIRASEKNPSSDSREISWKSQSPPQFLVVAPAARIAVGQLASQRIELGDVTIEVGKMEKNYACLALVALDEKPVAESRKLLLAVSARLENQGMGWNANRTSVGTKWGSGPTMAEFVPLTVTLPRGSWRAQALDGAGAPRAELPLDGCTLRLAEPTASLWYFITKK